MSITWEKVSQDVLDIAEELVTEVHPHLLNAHIGFLFREKAAMNRGKAVLGQASKVSDRDKTINNLDFIIWLSLEDWTSGDHELGWKQALVDHELCHCRYDDAKDSFYIRGHDIEEFNEVIERHGIWNHATMKTAIVVQPKLIELGREEKAGGVHAVDPSDPTIANDVKELGE